MVDQTDNICQVLFRIDITVGITVRFAAEQLLGKVYSVYELDYISQIALSIDITVGVACVADVYTPQQLSDCGER